MIVTGLLAGFPGAIFAQDSDAPVESGAMVAELDCPAKDDIAVYSVTIEEPVAATDAAEARARSSFTAEEALDEFLGSVGADVSAEAFAKAADDEAATQLVLTDGDALLASAYVEQVEGAQYVPNFAACDSVMTSGPEGH